MNDHQFGEQTIQQQVVSAAEQLLEDLETLSPPAGPLTPRHQGGFCRDVARMMRSCLGRLEATGLWGRDNEIPSRWLWQTAGARLEAGDLQWHARRKPQGYAGDYQMLQKIWAHAHSPTPWGYAFDAFFQYQAAPQAVRNRTGWVAREIASRVSQQPVRQHIVSVGSGPACDIAAALTQWNDGGVGPCPQVTLLDIDPYALEFATQQLDGRLPPDRLRTQRANLVKLPARQKAAHSYLANADLISCTGLFDYLDDADAAAMLRLFWQALRPGGELVVFNFAPCNPSRSYMEWIGNWYLIYRDMPAMWGLVSAAELPASHCEVDAEPQGVNLFLRARK